MSYQRSFEPLAQTEQFDIILSFVGCTWCVTEHVTFTNNKVRHAGGGLEITVRDSNGNAPPVPVNHIKVENNLFYDIGVSTDWPGTGRIFGIFGGDGQYIKFIHNTAEGKSSIISTDGPNEVNPNFTFRDNIVERMLYGIINSRGDTEGKAVLDFTYNPYTYHKNLLVNTSDEQNFDTTRAVTDASLIGWYPFGCDTPNQTATCGSDKETFVASSWNNVGFFDRSKRNYRLIDSSPYKNKASDGKDIGANQDVIEAAYGSTQPPDNSILADGGSGFADDFNDNSRDTVKWSLGVLNEPSTSLDNLVTVLEQNQRLEITPREGISDKHYYGYVSASTWNMTNAIASVEVVQKTFASADTIFAVGIDSNNWYRFITEDNQLYFQDKVAGTKNGISVAYNATQQRFWRFRTNTTANQLFFETSSDGLTWTTQRTVTVQFNITASRIELGAGTFAVQYAPGTAVFDNFRLER
jgi:hypothetical protein